MADTVADDCTPRFDARQKTVIWPADPGQDMARQRHEVGQDCNAKNMVTRPTPNRQQTYLLTGVEIWNLLTLHTN